MDVVTLALAKSYINKTLNGLGAIKGANCIVSSIVEKQDEEGRQGYAITFEWTGNSGTKEFQTFDIFSGKDGDKISDKDISKAVTAYLEEHPVNIETIKELTQEQYDALSEEIKNNGTLYYITD